jgi:hypothetical protein
VVLPVQVPAVIEHQCLEGSEAISGGIAPVHTFVLLPTSDDEITGFLGVTTADVNALGASLLVVDDVRFSRCEVVDQFVQLLFVSTCGSVGLQLVVLPSF